jgi:hypothetical protein
MSMGSEFAQAKDLWAQAQWEPDESKKKELAHQIISTFDTLLAADGDTQLDKAQRAAVHNLRGLSYAMLGDVEHLQLARRDYKRALKLNSRMGQASNNLKEVNKALHTQDAAAKNVKLEQRRLKYCCGCVPRCKKGPWKPKPKMVRELALPPICWRLPSTLRNSVSGVDLCTAGRRRARVCKASEENTSVGELLSTDLRGGWCRRQRTSACCCTGTATADLVGLGSRRWL